ncbi:chorismate-binding protein [Tsukamurella sp. 8F]|uniref:isochorismate synthase n=1 Tax=unclassified Tsukamurella TaxID=2633480 RepID=UPI0023B89CB2|nr:MULTISPECIES: chorismate-binding protein [unclassified Tsukamurella]MDF0531185.1 chorismate-binding protein [Tsukamurella sp. 8J]MDF0585868.1 chorismate-binding protein [Tsukamurella sp. 8F]
MTPHFILASDGESLHARGVAATFTEPAAAAAALRRGRHRIVVGALPFDLEEPAALSAPDTFGFGPGAPVASSGSLPALMVVGETPSPEQHVARVGELIERIRRGEADKVVLARAVDFAATSALDTLAMASMLAASDQAGNVFHADLSAAGDAHAGRVLVGSSPELLVQRRGRTVVCHPLAGTATEPDGLLESAKDRDEHAYVVDAIADALGPLCVDLDVPQAPSLTAAGELWHLGTVVRGTLRDSGTSALDLALALHPTPAVCGFPRVSAAQLIQEVEGPRGFYAGAVGWTDAEGDGHWRVSIRCAEVAEDRMSLRAWAGGGIVAASVPERELEETSDKLRTVLGPFDIEELVS